MSSLADLGYWEISRKVEILVLPLKDGTFSPVPSRRHGTLSLRQDGSEGWLVWRVWKGDFKHMPVMEVAGKCSTK